MKNAIRRAGMCLLGLFIFATIGCGPIQFTVGSGPARQELTHTTVLSDSGTRDRVAMIDISGMIINASPRGILSQADNPVSVLHEKLNHAAKDHHVKAVILRINSPGGTVTATDAMYREVERFKEKTGKPVITLMMDVAASGGYYLACSSDHVVAYPTTVTGSIGVILQTVTFKPAMQRVGIEAEAFTSGPNKAAGSPLGDMTDEHRAVLQRMVDDFYKRFKNMVRERRPNIPDDKFDMVTDGRVLTGDEALALGVVDELGDVYDAFKAAKQRAGIQSAELIRYHRPNEFVPSPYYGAPDTPAVKEGTTQVNLVQVNLNQGFPIGAASAGFYYLWTPPMP